MVVARRIIGKSLGMNMAEKEDTRTQEMDSALKKTGGVEKEVKVVAEVTPEEKKSGIMAVGLGGSRWVCLLSFCLFCLILLTFFSPG